jgi:hypothetical protein
MAYNHEGIRINDRSAYVQLLQGDAFMKAILLLSLFGIQLLIDPRAMSCKTSFSPKDVFTVKP